VVKDGQERRSTRRRKHPPANESGPSANESGPSGPHRSRRRLSLLLVVLVGIVVAGWTQVEPLEPVSGALDGEVSIIAHAGAQGHAPPNTMEAFEAALELGADTLEMDLQLTADGEVVTIHDGTVDRTTDGSGAVGEFTLEEFQALDAGATWEDDDGSTPFAGEVVRHATLRDVFEAFPDTPLVIELKTDGGEAIIQPVIDLVAEYDRQSDVIVASFSEDYLQPVREQLPDVATNMPETETYAFYVRTLAGLHPWWEPPGEVFQVPEEFDGRRVVTPRFTRAAERLGVEVQVWTVNEREQMHRVLDAGAHALMTDYPDRVVEVLADREAADVADPGGYGAQIDRAVTLQDELGWLTPLFVVATFLGDEEFYLLMLPITYWAISRRFGTRLGVMLLLSAGINGLLKSLFATPRPTFLVPEVGVVSETSFGLPSGHAQNGAAIWGLLAASVRSWPVRVGLLALIGAIGWSRIHLGVHFLEDITVGWAVGGALVIAFVALEGRFARWWSRVGTTERVLASVTAGLAMVAPATLLSGRLVNVAFAWPGLEDAADTIGASHVVTPAATLAGFGIGVALLQVRGGFDHRGPIPRRALRVLAGLIVTVVLWQGLGAVLPGGEEPLALVLRAVRYGLVGAWVGGIGPLLFVRFGLADPAPEPDPPQDPDQDRASQPGSAHDPEPGSRSDVGSSPERSG
jgi:glycerophosphoryl diester phosphodiesterase/membrane-associated phospholipid phosphatase